MAQLLSGRYCLVTGSSRGIGLAVARALVRYGAQVILHGRDPGVLQGLVQELPGGPEKHKWCAADLLEISAAKKLSTTVNKHFPRLDVLIHCAAELGPHEVLAHYDFKAWERVLRVNLSAPFILTQCLLPSLLKSPAASVVFLSSGAGRRGRAGWGGYGVSKFGIEGLTQIWADELRDAGVRVNAVNPGAIRTKLRAEAFPDEDPESLPQPDDITPLFVWLARAEVHLTAFSLDAQEWIGRDPGHDHEACR